MAPDGFRIRLMTPYGCRLFLNATTQARTPHTGTDERMHARTQAWSRHWAQSWWRAFLEIGMTIQSTRM